MSAEPHVGVTAGFLFDHGWWDRYCKITGMNVWAVNEGQVSDDELLPLTRDEWLRLSGDSA